VHWVAVPKALRARRVNSSVHRGLAAVCVGTHGHEAGAAWAVPYSAGELDPAALAALPAGVRAEVLRSVGLAEQQSAGLPLPGASAKPVLRLGGGGRGGAPTRVSRAFPSWNRSMLTDIYLCHACSYQEIENGSARTGSEWPAQNAQPSRGNTSWPCTSRQPNAELAGITTGGDRAAEFGRQRGLKRALVCIGQPLSHTATAHTLRLVWLWL
jgi:hypothetical protein